MADTKVCPACAEEVQAAARICRFCQYNFESGATSTAAPVTSAPPAPVTTAPQTNGLAIASLVLGIVWLGGLGSLLAVIFGHRGKKQIDQSNGQQTGRGMAIAGMVLGYIGVVIIVLVIALGAISVSVFKDQKAKGDTARLESTLKNAATAMETYATTTQGVYSGATLSDLENNGLIVPSGISVTPFPEDDEYCIEATDELQTMHLSTESFIPTDGPCP